MLIYDHFNPQHRERIETLLDLIRIPDAEERGSRAAVPPDEIIGPGIGTRIAVYFLSPDPAAWPTVCNYRNGQLARVFPEAGARLALGCASGPRDPDQLFFVLLTARNRFIFLSRSMALVENAIQFLAEKSVAD